jgi:invasion protein IalB
LAGSGQQSRLPPRQILARLVICCAAIAIVCDAAVAEPAKPTGWNAETRAQETQSSQPSPSAAQGIAFADWLLTCPGGTEKQQCVLSQSVRDAKDRRIIEMIAKRAGPAAYLELIVPLGIAIAYGVSLDLPDAAKLPARLVDCNAAGCRAVLALDDKTLAQIKAAKTLAVTFQDSKSGKIISISGSAKGFEQGIAMVLAAP